MSTIRVNNMTNVGGSGPTYAKGMVIQVVTASTSTGVGTTSTTFVDTGLSLSITPQNVNSKILIVIGQNGLYKTDNQYNGLQLQLLKDSTVLKQFASSLGWTGTATHTEGLSSSITFLDTPSTTSPTTYKTQISSNNGASVGCQVNGITSTITLMEIAG